MTQFSSRKLGDFDPLPNYRNPWGGVSNAAAARWGGYNHPNNTVPRPEFDHHRHNQPNPILVAVRENWIDGDSFAVIAENMKDAEALFEAFPHVTPEVIDHARKVLTRLAGAAPQGN